MYVLLLLTKRSTSFARSRHISEEHMDPRVQRASPVTNCVDAFKSLQIRTQFKYTQDTTTHAVERAKLEKTSKTHFFSELVTNK